MKYLFIALLFGCASIPKGQSVTYQPIDPLIQKTALNILTNKCNVCHATDNPSKVFTEQNMNGLAKKINRQVFFWKRMPKGDKIKLSKQEKQSLKNWIKAVKKVK